MISGKYNGILCIMILVVLSSGCIAGVLRPINSGCVAGDLSPINDIYINKTSDGTYTVAGVSFKGPDNWNVSAEKQSENFIKISAASYPKDSNSRSSKTPYIIPINIAQFIVSITSTDNLTAYESKPIEHSGTNRISNDMLIIDGNKAYRQIFTVNCNGTVLKCEQINFVKNNKGYIMTFQTPESDFNREKPNFDIILNSFKVD